MAAEPKDQGPRKDAVPDIVAPGDGQNPKSTAESQITSAGFDVGTATACLLYTSPSPRD